MSYRVETNNSSILKKILIQSIECLWQRNFGNDDLKKKGQDSKRDGSKYEKWEKGKTKLSKPKK
jgi:hypothetical protein